jgi:serralysin
MRTPSMAVGLLFLLAALAAAWPDGPPDKFKSDTLDGLGTVPAAPAAVQGQPVGSAQPEKVVPYTSFDGETETLEAWEGRNVALLVPAGSSCSGPQARKMLKALDAAYDYYDGVAGRKPIEVPQRMVDGRLTIAWAAKTCEGIGAGCGNVGYTGVEMAAPYYDRFCVGVRDKDEYDQVPFYELGRNFWHDTAQLEYKDPDKIGSVTTGYAVAMRFLAMDAAGVKPGPFNGQDFAKFRKSIESAVDDYAADGSLKWDNTLRIYQGPSGRSGPDLAASIFLRLKSVHGEDFMKRFIAAADALPAAGTTQQAMDNFVTAASGAAQTDLGPIFKNLWAWPVSHAQLDELAAKYPAPDYARYEKK